MDKTTQQNNEHSAEPWEILAHAKMNVGGDCNLGFKRVIANCGAFSSNEYDTHDENHANAQRIVDCVNALAGIKDAPGFMEAVKELEQKCQWAYIHGSMDCLDADNLYKQLTDVKKVADSLLKLFPTATDKKDGLE